MVGDPAQNAVRPQFGATDFFLSPAIGFNPGNEVLGSGEELGGPGGQPPRSNHAIPPETALLQQLPFSPQN